ncbi:MAG: 30S ribosomal protein S6 [Gammaproteobacteria bacterium]|tara:strand:+ start:246 stop:728 length:483 start_codon:yes stop_codon:yes gene_type:complete
MNHYEIVFILNPQQSAESKLFEKCKEQITAVNGIVHRSEEIGSRDLAYPINDCNKGHYYLINFQCESKELSKIEGLFKFNEAILRSSIVKKRRPETEPSVLLTQTKEKQSEMKKYSESKTSEREKQATPVKEIKEEAKSTEKIEKAEKESESAEAKEENK